MLHHLTYQPSIDQIWMTLLSIPMQMDLSGFSAETHSTRLQMTLGLSIALATWHMVIHGCSYPAITQYATPTVDIFLCSACN